MNRNHIILGHMLTSDTREWGQPHPKTSKTECKGKVVLRSKTGVIRRNVNTKLNQTKPDIPASSTPFLFHTMETTLYIGMLQSKHSWYSTWVWSSNQQQWVYHLLLMRGPFALPMISMNIQIWGSITGNLDVPLCIIGEKLEIWNEILEGRKIKERARHYEG